MRLPGFWSANRTQRSSQHVAELTGEQRTAVYEAGYAVAAIQSGVDGQDYDSVTIVTKDFVGCSFSIRENVQYARGVVT